jgi:hypothetical protein
MLTFSRKIHGRVGSRAKSLSRVLHDLIQPESIDVDLHLNPEGEVIRHLVGELGTAVVLAGEEGFDARVVDAQIERATVVGKISGTVGMCRISSFVSAG